MTGHQAIIALRLRGYNPRDVAIVVLDAEPIYYPGTHPENLINSGMAPEIDVLPKDNAGTLDLRCIAGLTVHVLGLNERRVKTVFNRAKVFGPAELIAATGEFMHWKPE